MQKVYIFLISFFVIVLTMGVLEEVNALPPEIPSVFYGEIHFMPDDGGPCEGDYVYAYVPGVDGPVAETQISTDVGNLVYSVMIPADISSTPNVKEGGIPGDTVTFKIGERVVAKGIWNSEESQNVVIHPPKADTGGPYEANVYQIITLYDSATDWFENDLFTFYWDLDGNGEYESVGPKPEFGFSFGGTFTLNLKATDIQGGEGFASTTFYVPKPFASMSLENLLQTYDGTEKQVSVSTNPEGLPVDVTYNGSSALPIDAGEYTVVATVVSENYQGTVTGTLSIQKADAEILISGLEWEYDGEPKPVTVTTDLDLQYSVTYNGLADPPSEVGIYEVLVTISDLNYQGSETANLVIFTTESLTLVPGWNLVSFTLQPYPSTSAEDIFSAISGTFDMVYAWDATGSHSGISGNWMIYDNLPETTDSLSFIDEGMGFWINITSVENINLDVKGVFPGETDIFMDTAASGWNLVGYPSASTSTPAVSFSSLLTQLSMVYEYDVTALANPWRIYVPDAPNYVNNLDFMQPGHGYWVKVTDYATWSVSY